MTILRPPTRSILSPPLRPSLVPQGAGAGGGGLPTFDIPYNGLVFALDSSYTDSFYSNIAKTANCTEGEAVAVWADLSGNGNDWTQPSAGNRPVCQVANARLFTAGTQSPTPDDYLIGPDISSWTEGSFFARFQITSAFGGAIWGVTAVNNGNSLAHWWYGGTTHYYIFGGSNRPTMNFANGTQHTELMNYEEHTGSDAITRAYINGAYLGGSNTGAVGFRSAPYLGCGVRSGVPQYSVQGYIYKFIGYNRLVTSEERTQINNWLNS